MSAFLFPAAACGINQNGSSNSACAYAFNCKINQGGKQKAVDCKNVKSLKGRSEIKAARPDVVSDEPLSNRRRLITAGSYDPAGLYIPLTENPCAFRLTFDARLGGAADPTIGGTNAYGWGYGFGACDRWQANAVYGFQLQYGMIAYPDGTKAPTPTWQPLPYRNEAEDRLPPDQITVDGQWHSWDITVRDGKLTASQDTRKSLTFSLSNVNARKNSREAKLPSDCTNHDIFMRVYNAAVEFQDIKVQPVDI
ncbi:hypothetical protein ACIPN8_09500 [Streptomyces sp. NPDC086082]|uniref:hypothetical protein n=1 Tax=Streptomyces sp. NPDC086082 TaxID=3365750 RepID=UPI00382FCA2B